MSEYPELTPLSAFAIMHITTNGFFNNIVQYHYLDSQEGYAEFLQDPLNYNKEISLYWDNLQDFLDEEKALVNDEEVYLKIVDCDVFFPQSERPCVQWIIQFEGKLHSGTNVYENFVEPDTLEYPIDSIYILEPPMKCLDVHTRLEHRFQNENQMVVFHGDKGLTIGKHEKFLFQY